MFIGLGSGRSISFERSGAISSDGDVLEYERDGSKLDRACQDPHAPSVSSLAGPCPEGVVRSI